MAIARVVQLSDTHLSHRAPLPDAMRAALEWIAADPPDLVVHSGDVVLEDPDDEDDRAFARSVLDAIGSPLAVIPGNHDIGAYGDDLRRDERLRRFRATWGDDRFRLDLAGWRLVGIDAYLLGEHAHDEFVRSSTDVEGPVAVFVHQPLSGDPLDGWEMPATARAAFHRGVAGHHLDVVASGHRHQYADRGRDVWAPSTTLLGEVCVEGADPRPGVVEHRFYDDGTFDHRLVHIT